MASEDEIEQAPGSVNALLGHRENDNYDEYLQTYVTKLNELMA